MALFRQAKSYSENTPRYAVVLFAISGTAAGSLCLPFLIEALASTYSFSGTLLILGACMLHISISAALYRPLATHVRIMSKHQKSTVVQLQEATAEAIKDQQYLLNKEPLEHQHHLKKLQSHQSSHHHHSNGVDPEAIMARLQVVFGSGAYRVVAEILLFFREGSTRSMAISPTGKTRYL